MATHGKKYRDAAAKVEAGREYTAQDAVSLGLLQDREDVSLLVGGMDLEPGALEAMEAGYVAVLVSPEHWLKGYISTKILAMHAEDGTEIPVGVWDTGGLVVTEDNIDEIIVRQSSDEAMAAALAPVGDEQIANSADYIQ